jgi:hypothetical protein
MITLKIIADFQLRHKFYCDNKDIWKYEGDALLNTGNKFHFWKYVNIDTSPEINPDTQYIFPIFWNPGPDFMMEVISYVRAHQALFASGQLIPVFVDHLEGNPGVSEKIDYFVKTFYGSVKTFLISADYNLKSRNNSFVFKYVDQWAHHIIPEVNIIGYQSEKLYINLNRVAREHRCVLMDAIINNNMLTDGYNTWANTGNALARYMIDNPDSKILHNTYDTLDVEDISSANPTGIVPIEYCKKSFIYIVTETHVENDVMFLSEKSYKPISVGMPFIILGNPGTLDLLRDKGYITFNKWFNENYDLPISIDKRIKIIMENLDYIKGLTHDQRVVLRQEMMPICRHNLDVYKMHQSKNSYLELLQSIIQQAGLK